MSVRFFSTSLMLVTFLFSWSVLAAEAPTQTDTKATLQSKLNLAPCTKDTAACRSLAVGVAALNIRERITSAVEVEQANRRAEMLCPEDNPQCCPPSLMPFCNRIQQDLTLKAKYDYRNGFLLRFDNCPFSKDVCEGFDVFCDQDERWLPWSGCTPISDPPIAVCPVGSKQVGFNCEPPPLCECGWKPNDKGICIPDICQAMGQPIPCPALCDIPTKLAPLFSRTPTKTRLGHHLQDRQVQLEAANRVREDLQRSLKLVEEEIRKLSSN